MGDSLVGDSLSSVWEFRGRSHGPQPCAGEILPLLCGVRQGWWGAPARGWGRRLSRRPLAV